MFKLLDIESFCKDLQCISSPVIFSSNEEFDENGLCSETIFGPVNSKLRDTTFAYIDLFGYVVHPAMFDILKRLDRRILQIIASSHTFVINNSGQLIEDEKGETGLKWLKDNFDKLKFRSDSKSREELIKLVHKCSKDGTLFVSKIPVIPPNYRPVYVDEDGRVNVDPLNTIYTKIIRHSNQFKSLKTGIVFSLMLSKTQNLINEYYKYCQNKIAKKSGIIRSLMLGKRVDFSGRAVAIPNPNLNADQIGIPLRMAVSIFQPFILHHLLDPSFTNQEKFAKCLKQDYNLELNADTILKLFKMIKKGVKIEDDELLNILMTAARKACYGRYVIMKRDPVLHPESMRGYKPIIVEGNCLQASTVSVSSHNLDFDGDTISIFHPLSQEAQQEIASKMTSSIMHSSPNLLVASLGKEMYLGLWNMTKSVSENKKKDQQIIGDVSDADLQQFNDPFIYVRYRGKELTVGRALFNSCLPSDYPVINTQVNKKTINKILENVQKQYGPYEATKVVNKLKNIGFKFATILASSINLEEIKIPKEVFELKKKLDTADTDTAAAILEKMLKLIKKEMVGTGMYDLIESGSGKGWSQPFQILVAKGLITDPSGNILPVIKSSFLEGLKPTEYFNASQGSRKGIADRTLNTSVTGYLARQLAYILNTVEANPDLLDCGTKRTLNIRLSKDNIHRLYGRYVVKNNKVVKFNPFDYKIGDIIKLRSPIFCRSKKLCRYCYGDLVLVNKSPYVGIIAAQVLGNISTQLIMRTFHTGGSASLIKRDMLFDIVQADTSGNLSL